MKILTNNVAVPDDSTHHAVWCATEGLVHDKFTSKVIRDLIRSRGIKTCIDAGAHIGTLTRVMLDEGCRVHAFEPTPDSILCLRHNCAEAVIHEYGLSDTEGFLALVEGDHAGTNCLRAIDHQPSFMPAAIKPLDDWPIDPQFIKLDIEGYELKALKGAKAMIERCRPIMLLEVNCAALEAAGDSRQALLDYLGEIGYVYRIIQPQCGYSDPVYDLLAFPI